MLDELTSTERKDLADIGDEETERHEYLIITSNGRFWDIKAGSGDPEDDTHDFNETVDYITINDTLISPRDDTVTMTRGVAFDYYWSVDTASIDILL